MRDNTDGSPAWLLARPTATAPAGVVPLLGGIAMVCQHLPRSLCVLVAVSGRKPRSELDRHDGGVLDVAPLLGASCLETRLGGSCCSPPMIATVQDSAPEAQCTSSGESKTVTFSVLAESRHPLATSFTTSRVDGASTREARGSY
jgi:hypothetical protein